MSGDSFRKITADLALYLRQQQESGMDVLYDEGSVAPPTIKPPAAASPTVTEPVPKPTPATDKFQMHCAHFVNETLKRIGEYQQPAQVADSSDLFNKPIGETVLMTRDEKAAALQELSGEVAACTACKLHPKRTNTVFGDGDPEAGLLLIGEAPGRDEDLQGLPFVGRSGKLLTGILKAIDFSREDVYICNILKCRPPQNRDPDRDEVECCEPFLKRQLEIIQPKVILCLGRHAAMTLLQTRSSLKAMREKVHFYQGIPVMATFHPAALLRNPNWKKDTWDDVRKLKALYTELVDTQASPPID